MAASRRARGPRRFRPPPIGTLRRAGVLDLRAAPALIASLPRLAGRGGSLGWLSHVNARVLGDKAAVIDRRGSLSWGEIDERANRLARVLQGRGIRAGETVSTLLRNGREMVEVILASQKLGAVTAPLNTWAGEGELRAVLETSAPSLIVADARHVGSLEGAEATPPRLVVDGDYEDALAAASPSPLPAFTLQRATPRVVIHTSGTTGRPKAANRGAGRADSRAFLDILSVVPIRREDVVLCSAPLFHSFGMLNVTLWAMLGTTLVLPDAFEPEGSLEWAERHRATVCAFVPVMLHRIAALPEDRRSNDLSSVRVVIASGSAIPPALRERVQDVFGPTLYDMYGSTETGLISIATPEHIAAQPASVGKVLPGVEVTVLDTDGRRVPPGVVGRLFVRGEGVFEGYTGADDPDHVDGYMSTGDLGRIDEEDYLFVEGRADDMVVVGGENVYPIEVEEAIMRLDGVREVAVAGVQDPEYGQVLVAFVVGDIDADSVRDACRASLASYKVPRRIEILDELPRTATGKVLVRQLVGGED